MALTKIYIAGPYTLGDTAVNVRNAIKVANDLADKGFAPYIPHFTHFWHLLFPRDYEFWLMLDKEYLLVCDALLRLPGESKGSDTEVEFALENNKLVFHDFQELIKHYEK